MLNFLCLPLVYSVIASRATDLSLMVRSHMSAKRYNKSPEGQVVQTRFSSLISRITYNVSILVISLAAFRLGDGKLAFKGIDVL
jgi:ABC-type spermidine/putrescine transport system permease subunit II